jgi:hypothetical protein
MYDANNRNLRVTECDGFADRRRAGKMLLGERAIYDDGRRAGEHRWSSWRWRGEGTVLHRILAALEHPRPDRGEVAVADMDERRRGRLVASA